MCANLDRKKPDSEKVLFDQIKYLIGSARALIIGQPVLFVLATGLIFAVPSVAGESFTYWAARLGGRALVERMSRRLKVKASHIDRAEALYMRWGVRLVLFGRILPGARTLVRVVPAGMARMDFGLVLGVSFGWAYLWNTLLVAGAYLLGFKLTLFGISIL